MKHFSEARRLFAKLQ